MLRMEVEQELERCRLLRDTYFSCSDNISEIHRIAFCRDNSVKLLEKISSSEHAFSPTESLLLAGQVLNTGIEYEPLCEEYLSRYLQLVPDDLSAWAELGDCLMKKPDLDQAVESLEFALTLGRTAHLLTSLATALRFKMGAIADSDRKRELTKRALLLSEEAVQLDANYDGAWVSLGNSHLAYLFFSQEDSCVARAIAAYKKALTFKGPECNPDVHINMATVLRYNEMYAESLDHFQRALKLSPDESYVSNRLSLLKQYLVDVFDAVTKRVGRPKSKKRLDCPADVKFSYPSPLQASTLSSLHVGQNEGKYINGTVLLVLNTDQQVAYTCVVCDPEDNVFVLNIYGVSQNFCFTIGDVVSIAEPYFTDVKGVNFDWNGERHSISFKGVRVPSPTRIQRNGKALDAKMMAVAKVVSTDVSSAS